MTTKATIIVLEGPEASGKTTTAKLLIDKLKSSSNKKVIHLREPGSSSRAEDIRKYIFDNPDLSAKERSELFSTSRKFMVEEVNRELMDADNIILMDRSFVSTFVYQGHAEKGVTFDQIKHMNQKVLGRLRINHLFILSGDLDVMRGRIQGRSNDDLNFFDLKEREFHSKVNEGYLRFLKGGAYYNALYPYIQESDYINTTDNTPVEIVAKMLRKLKGRGSL